MEKICKYENGTIQVILPEIYNQEELRKATEDFLKRVIREGKKNDDINSTGNFSKK